MTGGWPSGKAAERESRLASSLLPATTGHATRILRHTAPGQPSDRSRNANPATNNQVEQTCHGDLFHSHSPFEDELAGAVLKGVVFV